MRGMTVVLQNDARDIVRSKTFIIIVAIIGALIIGVAIGVPIALNGWLGSGIPWGEAKPLLDFFMGLVTSYVPLIVIFICIATWSTEPIAKEKARGPIESLLATPLTARAVWLGKSLAIFLPAYLMALAGTLIVILAMNFGAILPLTGHFVLPLSEALTAFLLFPLLMLTLVLVGVIFSLITNPVVGQIIIIFFGTVSLNVVGQLGGWFLWLLPSWDYALYILAGAAILGALAFYLSRNLTKEKIILSSKGKWA